MVDCFPKTASVARKEKNKSSYKILHNFIDSPVFLDFIVFIHNKLCIIK